MMKKTEGQEDQLFASPELQGSSDIHVLNKKIARMEAELEASRKNELYLQALLDTQSSSFILLDENICMLAFNKFAYNRNLKIRKKELKIGEPIRPFVPDERWDIFKDSVKRAIGGEVISYLGNVKDNWYDVHYEPVVRDGKVIACAYYSKDVTEIRAAELALKESEERYRKLVEESPNPTIVHSDHKFLFINTAALRAMGGSSAESYIGKSLYGLVHNTSWGISKEWIEKSYHLKEPLRQEVRFSREDGKTVHAVAAVNQITYDGKPAVQIAFSNISRLKEAEKKLKRSETMLSTAQLLTHLGSFDMDVRTLQSTWSDELYRILGYEPGEAPSTMETFLKAIHPDDLDKVAQIQNMLKGMEKPVHYKFKIVRPDREIRHVEVEILTTFDEKNRPNKIYGALLDVTEKYKSAKALEESERLYRLLTENTKDFICLHAPDGRYQWVSPSAKEMLGYEPQELIGKSPYEFFHPDDIKMVREDSHEPIKEGERTPPPVESRFRRKDGSYIWIESIVQPFFNEAGELVQIETASRDITERKRAAEALQKEKENVQTYWDLSGAMFVIVGSDGRVKLINKRGCEILEGKEEDIIGKHWFDDFMYEVDQVEFKARFKRILTEKQTIKDLSENRIRSCKGNMRVISWKNMLQRDENGNPTGILSSGEDITERRRLERENIIAMLSGEELERRRFAAELHDGLALLLSTAKMHVTNLEMNVSCLPPEKHEVFEIMQKLIDDSIGEIRTMIEDLQPRILESYGLVAALDELCKKLAPPQISLHFYKVGSIGRLPSQIEISMYRMAQELIGNALKHAHAKNIVVQLVRHDKTIMLMIDDDGIGFDPNLLVKHKGYGFKNVKNRAASLQGDVIIDSAIEKGTIATVEIPLNIMTHE